MVKRTRIALLTLPMLAVAFACGTTDDGSDPGSTDTSGRDAPLCQHA